MCCHWFLSDLSSLGNCNYPWEGIFTRPEVTCRLWCSVAPPSPDSADFIVVTAGCRELPSHHNISPPANSEKIREAAAKLVNPSYANLEDYANFFFIRGDTFLTALDCTLLKYERNYLFKQPIKSVEAMSSGVNIENYMTCQIPINFFWFSSFRCHQIFRPVDQDTLYVSFIWEVDTSVHIYS